MRMGQGVGLALGTGASPVSYRHNFYHFRLVLPIMAFMKNPFFFQKRGGLFNSL